MGAPVLGREVRAVGVVPPAVLERVAALAQVRDRRVERHRLGDLRAELGRAGDEQRVRKLGANASCEVQQDLPLGPRLVDARPGDLGAQDHAPLGRRLGDAAWDLVARRRREDEHGLARLGEHLTGDDDVHVDPKRRSLERLADARRIGQDVQEVAARGEEDVQLAAMRRVQHLGRLQARLRRHIEAPELREAARVVLVDRQSAGKRGRIAAHLGAALDTRVAADRHQAAARLADPPPRKRQVDDRPHPVLAAGVLGHPHAPDQDPALCVADEVSEARASPPALPRQPARAPPSRSPEWHREARQIPPCERRRSPRQPSRARSGALGPRSGTRRRRRC